MISLKSEREIEKMREANRIVAWLLHELKELVKPGVSTLELDQFAEEFILRNGGKPAFKGYQTDGLLPYPSTLCTSINSTIVHGIPSDKKILKEGDIIGIDVGVIKDGFFGDAARTYAVGSISESATNLLKAASEALMQGLDCAREGNRVGDISAAIGNFVARKGYFVADNLTGHGVGRKLHEEPVIPNSGKAGSGPRLKSGMTLAIEPMINIGTNRVIEKGWEYFVQDGSLSAHFEHTVLVTRNEPEILTLFRG
jgi:methionyl aminopeptidase